MKILLIGGKGMLLGALSGITFDIFDTGHHLLPAKLFLFACIGLVVGLFCGEPVWKENQRTTPLIKGGVGNIVGLILMTLIYLLVDKKLGITRLTTHNEIVGNLYGGL